MFDHLSSRQIASALDELSTFFGVKEEMALRDEVALLRSKDMRRSVQEIAGRLGLPIRINLTCLPEDFGGRNGETFGAPVFARTKWSGLAIGGTAAQVSIPGHLPMFGTFGLQGYPISVRVTDDCRQYPEAFLTVILHELSHVLLASVQHPQRDSELHADLLPILLGFGSIVRRGRRTLENRWSLFGTRTLTTTYGYLTDYQFGVACRHVRGLLERYERHKVRLMRAVGCLRRRLKEGSRRLGRFRDYFAYLDRRPPKTMRKGHAARVVHLHGQHCDLEWENGITAISKDLSRADGFARQLSHYLPRAAEELNSYLALIQAGCEELERVIDAITRDERLLRKYVPLRYRLKRVLWRGSF